MERLKAILADKILDVTSLSGDDVKAKVEKIQRFRDFANACQTLMTKYPLIEDELIKMVNDGDFDTKVASSRVDSVIRLAYNGNEHIKSEPIQTIEEKVSEPVVDSPKEPIIEDNRELDLPKVENRIIEVIVEKAPENYLPEDVDYEEVKPLLLPEEETNEGYVAYEETEENSFNTEIPEIEEEIIETQTPTETETVSTTFINVNAEPEIATLSEEELASIKRKATIRKVIQIIGIVLAVVILIIVIKFILKHWLVILSVIGGMAVIAMIVWFIKKKKS
ncbi:hypothetical protein [Dysgonomonas sp. ZJ279]|uniref:hypothetical protein n=1 Tax=Dysgonomonas sp. ZJ279 TaxID=2709796 RepID=UPI0013EB4DB2|nr:hypothetical protein [Dysgonomonas sp. ZJ279]